MSIKYCYLLAAAAFVGCASTGTQGATRGNANVLSAAEIAEHHADVRTAYDAVARLRPNWLAPHGPVSSAASSYPTVFVDGQLVGDFNALRNIPAYHVGAIQYYDVTQAGATFGIRAGGGGAIAVRMASPR
jgi:hypothetical protein